MRRMQFIVCVKLPSNEVREFQIEAMDYEQAKTEATLLIHENMTIVEVYPIDDQGRRLSTSLH